MANVSVIVPAYNTAEYIAQTLDSIERQTFADWECMIVDDGSTDNTADVVKPYCQKDSRFHYLYQKNSGLSAARNTGIQNSTGAFILPVDSDNYIANTYIEKAYNYFVQHPETSLVYGVAQKFGNENGILELSDYSYEKLLFNGNMIDACAMFKRSDYNRIGGFRLNIQKGGEDWDFWVALLSPISIVYKIPEVMFYYRIRSDSLTETYLKQHEQELRQKIYWNNAEKYDQYLPNFSYHRYFKEDCEKILGEVPDMTRGAIEYYQNHIFLGSNGYTWKHAIINKIARWLGVGVIFMNDKWNP